VAEPDSLDDLLRAESTNKPQEPEAPAVIDPNDPSPNMTRDIEVSKIISRQDAAGTQVTIIRGSERTNIQFGPPNTEQNVEP
jgi:hypothetical protein